MPNANSRITFDEEQALVLLKFIEETRRLQADITEHLTIRRRYDAADGVAQPSKRTPLSKSQRRR